MPKKSTPKPGLVQECVAELPGISQLMKKQTVYSVSEITSMVKDTLESDYPDIWVEGEISNYTLSQAGHAYFSLKDKNSLLNCVIFRMERSKVKFQLENGLHILLHGRISLYEQRGQYQLIADKMEIAGLGALQQAFEQLKEKLCQEGLFEQTRKRALPVLPQRIGIITSPTGAALRDILNILNRRFANIEIIIAPVLVQGMQAAPQIVEALDLLNQWRNIDVIIITRGGGSLEDLLPFNQEIVARAVYRSDIPVISAIGHETDYSICDFVADLRAPTPSAAAELVVKNKSEFEDKLNFLSISLRNLMKEKINDYYERMDYVICRPVFQEPTKTIQKYAQIIDDMTERSNRTLKHSIEIRKMQLKNTNIRFSISSPELQWQRLFDRYNNATGLLEEKMERILREHYRNLKSKINQLNALSPLSVLGRGYSITYQLPQRTIIQDSRSVQKGDKIEIHLHQGILKAEISEKEDSNDRSEKKS